MHRCKDILVYDKRSNVKIPFGCFLLLCTLTYRNTVMLTQHMNLLGSSLMVLVALVNLIITINGL